MLKIAHAMRGISLDYRLKYKFREICAVSHLAQPWQAFVSIFSVGTEICSSTKITLSDCNSVEPKQLCSIH